ncbi:PhaM family polyhydroxyalkanoate granule multifunctional regulatory protein [Roseateles sp. PN1]|uniref:PhaM family polyhydroxyalkanoate granule multifunctional regulatory protein n=1 Tax=Roseateles sp. PN1 TaxID=3137372 RepID=UPI003139ACAF
MADNSFSKFVPGFDFLQGLVKNAGAALPGIGQWVAPTLNPEELGKRIEELRTVQFWLEQNARMLGATIQALEVQRMTLSTLKSLNVPLAELSNALKLPTAEAMSTPAWPAMPGIPPEVMAAAAQTLPKTPAPAPAPKPAAKAKADKSETAAPAIPAAVDPLQWWGALSQQFTQLAATAMKENATDAAKNLAGAIVKQSFDAAGDTLRKAAAVPGAVAGSMVESVSKSLAAKPATKPATKASAHKPAVRNAVKKSKP